MLSNTRGGQLGKCAFWHLEASHPLPLYPMGTILRNRSGKLSARQACHIMMCTDLLHHNSFSYSSCGSISLHEYLPHTLIQVWDRLGSTLLAAAASSVLLLCHLHLSLPAELLLLLLLRIGCLKIDGTKEYIQK